MGALIKRSLTWRTEEDTLKRKEFQKALKESLGRSARCGLDAAATNLKAPSERSIALTRKNVLGGIAYTRTRYLGYLNSLENLAQAYDGAILYIDHSLHVFGTGGKRSILSQLKKRGVVFGCDLAEESAGTNAASLSRDLMQGVYLEPSENYNHVFSPYACLCQGPLKIGADDFIFVMAVLPKEQFDHKARAAFDHAFLSLGVISKKDEHNSFSLAPALFDKFLSRRGYGCIVVDENGRVASATAHFLEAYRLQGSRIVGRYLKDCLPDLTPAYEIARMHHPADELSVPEITLNGKPAWTFVTTVASGTTTLYAIAVQSAPLRNTEPFHARELPHDHENIAREHPQAARVARTIRSLSQRDENILIDGESGTGKKTVARRIHDLSARSQAPFIACDCRVLTNANADTILFGIDETHPGLFEKAQGGTLFIDGLTALCERAQLLFESFLDTKSIVHAEDGTHAACDVRLIFASTLDPDEPEIAQVVAPGLLWRLPTARLYLPALVNVKECIPAFAFAQFQEEASRHHILMPATAESRDFAFLENTPWPGNARELCTVIARAFTEVEISCEQDTLEYRAILDMLQKLAERKRNQHEKGSQGKSSKRIGQPTPQHKPEPEAFPLFEDYEKERIVQLMRECRGNKTAVAKKLGITRQTLYTRLDAYHLR